MFGCLLSSILQSQAGAWNPPAVQKCGKPNFSQCEFGTAQQTFPLWPQVLRAGSMLLSFDSEVVWAVVGLPPHELDHLSAK